MPKLCQINALVSGRKGEVEKAVGDIYKIVQKPDLFTGRERSYQPRDDEHGERLPAERQKVQHTVRQQLAEASAKWVELWDLVLTQDSANQQAKADIVVDGHVVMKDVPVTNLLFLEKQVNDLETFISRLPTPDPSEEWEHDTNTDLLKTKPSQTVRGKKVPKAFVKYEATKEHPAQVETYTEDIQVGTWTQILYSGCMPATERNAMLARVKKLKDAIKFAREQANLIEVEKKKAGESIFGFVFGTNGKV